MYRCFIILFLLCAGNVQAQEQSDRNKPPAPEFGLSTIIIRDVLRDYNIGFMQRIGWHHTLEARIGWVHPNRIVSKYYEQYLLSTDWKFSGPSFYVQLNKWKYSFLLKKQRQCFFGVYAGYRYMFYTNRKMPMGGKDHSELDEELTLSQWRNDVLVLGSIGLRLSKYSTSEISLGVCFSWTHSHLIDTRFHPYAQGTLQDETYRRAQLNRLPGAEGFSVLPVLRVSSRIGWFSW